MFDAAPASTTHSLLQDPDFASALRALGQNPITLSSGQTLLSRMVWGIPMLMLPRATPPPGLSEELRAMGLHRRPLILSPDHPCSITRAVRLRGPQPRAVWDLTPDIDHRRAALHGKWRNTLKRAEKSNLRVSRRLMPPDLNHPLLAREQEQARARGYQNWPPALTAAFASTAPAKAQLFTAKQAGQEVAQMLFLRHGTQATYHIGWSNEAGKAAGAHNLLLWQASIWLGDAGTLSLDLGLLNPRSPGLSRFKQRTGAQVLQTGGTWLRWTPLARRRLA